VTRVGVPMNVRKGLLDDTKDRALKFLRDLVNRVRQANLPAKGIETAAMKATPLKDWWAPPGQTKYLIVQGADDQIAPPENGAELKKELGERATLINVAGAAHLLPLEQPQTTASHIISFVRQLGKKP
jgi:pimeloyl-ACP methyl ester carboxylesterase